MNKTQSTDQFMAMAEAKFIEEYDNGYRLHCSLCGKAFKGNSATTNLKKHLHEDHQAALDRLSNELKLNHLEVVEFPREVEYLGRILKEPRERLDMAMEEFLKKFKEDPSYTINWHSEDLVMAESVWKWWENNIIGWFEPERFVSYPDVLNKVRKAKEELTSWLIAHTPSFSSTSPMANIIDVWDHKALAKLMGTFSSSMLSTLIYYLENIVVVKEEINLLHESLGE
jgi:hypothetical protein